MGCIVAVVAARWPQNRMAIKAWRIHCMRVLIAGDGASSLCLARIASEYRDIERETRLSITLKTPSVRKTSESFLPYKLTASCSG